MIYLFATLAYLAAALILATLLVTWDAFHEFLTEPGHGVRFRVALIFVLPAGIVLAAAEGEALHYLKGYFRALLAGGPVHED